MKNSTNILAVGILSMSCSAIAQVEGGSAISPLHQGFYVAPLGSYAIVDKRWNADSGYGGIISGGYRSGILAFEIAGSYEAFAADAGNKDTKVWTGGGNILLFPFTFAPNLYGLGGGGYLHAKNRAFVTPDQNGPLLPPSEITGVDNISGQYIQAGLGHLFKFSLGTYDMALRAEALARHTDRDHSEGGVRSFDDFLFNVGLQLPLSRTPPPPPPVEQAVAVVPVAPPADTDGDGITDDKDQCPNTPSGTQVDGVGCPLPPPCKPPEAGQKVDLSGCAVGDSIVLRGVNFEYDKAKLTVNAQTILDGVADALAAAPNVTVEVDGHTDSRGSDAYNQTLSERRAQSVMQYLADRGVAAERMSAKGMGETEPVADNDTDEGRELNRRVELKIVGVGSPDAAAAPEPSEPAADAGQGVDDGVPPNGDAMTPDAAPAPADTGDVETMPDSNGPSSALEPSGVSGNDMSVEPQPGQ